MQYVPKPGKDSGQERQEIVSVLRQESERRSRKKIKLVAVSAALLLLMSGAIAYYALTPGKYDSFAKCLTEKGAVMYGEDWCPYTKAQKAMFGKSFKYVNYEQKKDLALRPTWVIAGTAYERVQSFERLASLTGCEIF